MNDLIPLDKAKEQLQITDDLHDAEAQDAVDDAVAIVLDYVKPLQTGEARPDWPWTAATLPLPVKRAMLVMTTFLYVHRGDPLSSDTPEYEQIWKTVDALVKRFYDPAIA